MKKELQFLFMGMSHDQHLHRVAKCIEQQNGLVQLIDSRQIPNQPAAPSLYLGEKGNSWDVIWIRHLPPLFPGAAQHFKPEEIQKQRALRGYVLQWLAQQIAQGKAVFPRLTEGTFDQYKAIDLHMAKQAQLQTPVSLSTLSMEEALNFINEQGQDLILKPMMGGAAAKHLSEVSLENAFSNYTACTLQEYVRGTNCRVIYFSGLPLKAFIGSNCTAADWRDDTTITWAPYELSAEIQNKLHHFFRLSGHTIASVDLIITRSDGYFLEANTTPSWLDFHEPYASELTQMAAQFFFNSGAS